MGKLVTLPNGTKVYLIYAPEDEKEARKLARELRGRKHRRKGQAQ